MGPAACAWSKSRSGGRTRLVASCLYNVEEGLSVQTETDKVKRIRSMIIELLWPSTQRFAKEYGVTHSRFATGMADCSLCGLCVRYCAEVKKANALYLKGRGIDRKPALVAGSPLECSTCGECFLPVRQRLGGRIAGLARS